MKKTILVVDDFASIRRFICDVLEKKGYQAVGACSGREAFEMLLTTPTKIDLVLTDYNMPDITGYDLLNQIRNHPQTNTVPVVFLTTERDPEKMKASKDAGLSAWIKKPYRPEVFFSKLENIINHNPLKKTEDSN